MLPAVTDCDAGAADSEKSGLEEFTCNVTVALWLKPLFVPARVRVKVPASVAFAVDIVKVDDPGPMIDDGLKLAVAPPGKPLVLRDTAPLNPFTGVTDTV